MRDKQQTAPGAGGEPGTVGDETTTRQSHNTTPNAQAQALATYALARLLAGAGDADLDAIRAAWPDAPTNDLDALRGWLVGNADVAQAIAKIDPEGPPPGGPPLALLTADAILTTDWPEPVWAVPQLLPVGLSILAGKPKLGKSWLALQIAQSVAAGGVALGERVERGPILYLALEDPPRRLKERMLKQSWPTGLPADFMPLGQFAEQVGDLCAGGGDLLARQIEVRGYRLVVVDTLSRAVYGDQNDVEKMTAGLTPLQEIAHGQNCAIVLVDHHRKGNGFDNPDAIGDILGSTGKGAMCDTAWGLYRERGKSGAKLAITGRDVVERNLALTFDGLTGCWQCDGDADELEMTERRQEIVNALEGLGRATLKQITEIVEQPKSHTHTRLQDLVNAGAVVRVGVGRNVYYQLPDDM